jgi:hypothetical protein
MRAAMQSLGKPNAAAEIAAAIRAIGEQRRGEAIA